MPSPPYVVPIRVNKVSLPVMGNTDPSQNIQLAGAKFPANIRISPTKGCDMGHSTPSRRRHSAEPARKTGDIYIPLGTTERQSRESITDPDGRPIHFSTPLME